MDTLTDAPMPPNAPASDAPTPDGTTYRQMQRSALRDLVALATECAATETEIEKKLALALDEAAKEEKKSEWDTDHRVSTLKGSVETKYSARVEELAKKTKEEVGVIESGDRKVKATVDREHDSVMREARSKYDQAVWLADSVLEAVQSQIPVDAKKAQDEYDVLLDALVSLESDSIRALQRFGEPIPKPIENDLEGVTPPTEPAAAFASSRNETEKRLGAFRRMFLPGLFVSTRPLLILMILAVAAAAGTQQYYQLWTAPKLPELYYAVGGTIVGAIIVGIVLRSVARKQVSRAYVPLRNSLINARVAADTQLSNAANERKERLARAQADRDAEVKVAKGVFDPVVAKARMTHEKALNAMQEESRRKIGKIKEHQSKSVADLDAWKERTLGDLQSRYSHDIEGNRRKRDVREQRARKNHEDATVALQSRLTEGLAQINAPMNNASLPGLDAPAKWGDRDWKNWEPTLRFAPLVRFGEIEVDLRKMADQVPRSGDLKLALPAPFKMPVSLAFPRLASLMVQTDRSMRDQAIAVLQMSMTRLLTSLPPGRVRFTIIDPVGLGQSFAGFMHLADYDDALVGGRIWTSSEQIDQRLADLTDHMEKVIQKYLRNEFETIDQYNAQAGELAEPYRFLVIADFPNGFQPDAFRRLASIAASGARCGVYTLISRDTRQALPHGTHLDDIEAASVNLVQQGDKLVWRDDVFQQFELAVDPAPPESTLNEILHVVGEGAKDANRVEVPFDTITPEPSEMWTHSTTDELAVPVGRTGATRLQQFRLGRGVAQHALIAGKTGSGKSSLLHTIVTNTALWHHPDEVEFFLIDFKKGVEFKTYATHLLPHARAIAVESDREFGLSVLQRLDAEMSRRGDLYRKVGVQDLASYRAAVPGVVMPRTILIIDEFQEFFTEDDKLAQEASLLLDRLVRQGRAFGVHVLLGSQTIGGAAGLPRTTLGQMAVRVALQCSEADSQMILGDNNSAARLLSRPGEAIYNDAGGLVESNSPFQVAWLPDDRREKALIEIRKRADADERAGKALRHEPPIVFEGNAAADITRNPKMSRLIDAPVPKTAPAAPVAILGDPVAIKEPTSATLRRQGGANIIMVGQQDESAMGIMQSALLSLAAQHAAGAAKFYIFDGTPADSPLVGWLTRVKGVVQQDVNIVEWRNVESVVNEIATEVARRQGDDSTESPAIYILYYGLQRYRMLRKQEESFSFSSSDEEPKPRADKQFGDIIREGPNVGVHTIAWIDTPASLERTLERNGLREFDNRILFQMSAADSSNIVDSPAANKLGFHRALIYSEEQGVMEKFRPFAPAPPAYLEKVKAALTART